MAFAEFQCCNAGHAKIFSSIWRPFRRRRRSLESLLHRHMSGSLILSLIYVSLIVLSDFVMMAKCEQWGDEPSKRLVDSEDAETAREPLSSSDLERLHQLVKIGLNLTHLPNVAQINISQREYAEKYQLYLDRVQQRKRQETNLVHEDDEELIFNSFAPTSQPDFRRRRPRSVSHDLVFVRFPLPEAEQPPPGVEEATLRLLLQNRHHHSNASRDDSISLKVYQLIEPYGRIFLDGQVVSLEHLSGSRWVELDVSRAVESWMEARHQNLGLEVHCDGCHRNGLHVVHDASQFGDSDDDANPALNIVTRVVQREKRSRQYKHYIQHPIRRPRQTDCQKNNQKCCRHRMEVAFKDVKGYEFIIQPKSFDAGFCRGKCPPKYNPAHHHALLQSLIWKQDKSKAPRPCCAPLKLVDLEVLHVDERDPTKLKVATWTDMRVLECACS
ncbi:transforming growth factor beta-2 proprotein [Phlebotomus argentipes]|uniref:transforming growth factor beta-2 proprotein n=1 Tax=Phlebotomus argentipes TaxID=94469 RepID=UPI002892CFE5|nr:transforming growth factor beta-2 proprotein [Phlebotomus argentipes]